MGKKTGTAKSETADERPIATIYQNSEQIAGILQQLFRSPLLVDESRESSKADAQEGSGNVDGHLEGSVKVPLLPGLPGFGASAALETGLEGRLSSQATNISRQQFAYTQAYNLHLVREELRRRGLLSTLGEAPHTVGDFVEYRSTFDPVELTTLLDVMSPTLVGAIAKFLAERSYSQQLSDAPTRDEIVTLAERRMLEAESRRALAAEVARAFQADSRQAITREYYGRVSQHLTAVTICDSNNFVIEDPDRLLDGTFTVLGKVISAAEDDVPTFSRNKVLRNIAPDAFDMLIDQLQEALSGAKIGSASAQQFVEWKLKSRITGTSWRILPLAIYT